jgi:hypothetical protein
MKIRAIAWVLVGALAACGGGSGSGDDDDDDDTADGGGDDDGDGGGGFNSCRKIDLVVSVDPSSSMQQELAAMSAIFGDFADALLDVNDDFDNFRTGVVDSCPRPATFNTVNKAGTSCGFASGESWIDSSSASMVTEFQCVGDLNTTFECNTGNDEDEQPVKAAIAALGDGINPGFLRDDALLVVMAISDEDEEMNVEDGDDPAWSEEQIAAHSQTLYDGLVATKGDVKQMVFIGIGGGPAGCSAEQGTYGGALPADVINATTDRFIAEERGEKWDLCQGDLDQALTAALDTIVQACDEFEPVE